MVWSVVLVCCVGGISSVCRASLTCEAHPSFLPFPLARRMAADEFAAATEAAYQICAAKLQEEVDGVLRQTNRTSFQKIQAFLERHSSSGGGGSSSEGFSQSPYTELPVALVHAGCNTADHALTLRQLLHHLKMNCSTHLAVRLTLTLTSTQPLLLPLPLIPTPTPTPTPALTGEPSFLSCRRSASYSPSESTGLPAGLGLGFGLGCGG